MKRHNTLSSFWMTDTAKQSSAEGKDLIKLSQYRRAIANFVNIVTGQNIPVKFHSKDESYTDGQVVTISSNLDDNNFDPVVGLALHEGSHILLTDFDVLNFSASHFPELIEDVQEYFPDLSYHERNKFINDKLRVLLNFVEDRRIDYHIYKNAPGYRGYYDALYNKYFYAKVVDKALKSENYTSETWESYEFRIINILNKNTDLSALKGLKHVWELLDIKNIDQVKNTRESLKMAVVILQTIIRYITQEENEELYKSAVQDESGDGEESDQFEPSEELTDNQHKQLSKAISKQKDFLNNNIKKSKLSKKDSDKVSALESSNTSMEHVEYNEGYGNYTAEVIVIKNLTQKFIETDPYHIFEYGKSNADFNQESINDGVRLGTLLGKKLKITNEGRTTTFTRQKRGKIDKRLLSELGCNNSAVFYRNETTQYKNSFVHISIDGSGSMYGERFKNAMITAVAIAKAASMNSGIDVVISFRYTSCAAGSFSNKEYPVVLVAYDSRKDKFSKITRLFKYLRTCGTTPESLCFQAIKEQILNSNTDTSKYFINLSDGDPGFYNDERGNRWYYSGQAARTHCRKTIKEFEKEGINILSYFVSEYEPSLDRFKEMYGATNTALIHTHNISEIARTLNKLFLSNDNKVVV